MRPLSVGNTSPRSPFGQASFHSLSVFPQAMCPVVPYFAVVALDRLQPSRRAPVGKLVAEGNHHVPCTQRGRGSYALEPPATYPPCERARRASGQHANQIHHRIFSFPKYGPFPAVPLGIL